MAEASHSSETQVEFTPKSIEDRSSVEMKLESGEYTSKFRLDKHAHKFKSHVYETIFIVYDGEKIVDDWFQCGKCGWLKCINVKSDGTNPFRRHVDDKKGECKKKALEKQTGLVPAQPSLCLSRDDLARAFSNVCSIGAVLGKVSQDQFSEIMPDKFSDMEKM